MSISSVPAFPTPAASAFPDAIVMWGEVFDSAGALLAKELSDSAEKVHGEEHSYYRYK